MCRYCIEKDKPFFGGHSPPYEAKDMYVPRVSGFRFQVSGENAVTTRNHMDVEETLMFMKSCAGCTLKSAIAFPILYT